MGTIRRRGKARREMSLEEEDELWFGVVGTPVFSSAEARRASWVVNRDRLMDELPSCVRPWGYFEYEVAEQPAKFEEHIADSYSAAELLERRGLLTDRERTDLMERRIEEASRYARFAREGIPLNAGQQRFLERARAQRWIREAAA